MSTRICLTISRKSSRDDPSIIVTRLLTRASFHTFDGNTKPTWAIVDTGGPTSLIPYKIWRQCPVLTLKDTIIQEIVNREACDLPVIEGVIGCTLSDGHTTLPRMVIRAHLASEGVDVPLLIGFDAMLERMSLCCAIWNNKAYLELPEP